MAVDHYGNTLYVGDRVTKVGSSGEYYIDDISTTWTGKKLLDLDGHNRETRVKPENVIKQSYFMSKKTPPLVGGDELDTETTN